MAFQLLRNTKCFDLFKVVFDDNLMTNDNGGTKLYLESAHNTIMKAGSLRMMCLKGRGIYATKASLR